MKKLMTFSLVIMMMLGGNLAYSKKTKALATVKSTPALAQRHGQRRPRPPSPAPAPEPEPAPGPAIELEPYLDRI